MVVLAACGGKRETPVEQRFAVDDAFVLRAVQHQQTGLALARIAADDADKRAVRQLAGAMVTARERTLPALIERAGRVASNSSLTDLGVSEEQAGERIGPDALKGAQPLDTAFLTLMSEHVRGTLKLTDAELHQGTDPAVQAVARDLATAAAAELGTLSKAMSALSRDG